MYTNTETNSVYNTNCVLCMCGKEISSSCLEDRNNITNVYRTHDVKADLSLEKHFDYRLIFYYPSTYR